MKNISISKISIVIVAIFVLFLNIKISTADASTSKDGSISLFGCEINLFAPTLAELSEKEKKELCEDFECTGSESKCIYVLVGDGFFCYNDGPPEYYW